MDIKWILSTTATSEAVHKAEEVFNVKFPNDYVDIILKHNRAVPKPCCFFVDGNEHVFSRLLSINEDDQMNIYEFSDVVNQDSFNSLIAFGEDPFGNFWCFNYKNGNDNPTIVYWDHELAFSNQDYVPLTVSISFKEFINNLKNPQN